MLEPTEHRLNGLRLTIIWLRGPMHTVFDALEVPMVAFGLGNANSRDHGGDENVRIADYYTHIELVEELIRSYE